MNRGEFPHPVPHARNPGVWPFLAGRPQAGRHETAQGEALIAIHNVRAGYFPIPKGLRPKAQGCEERATLGGIVETPTTPTGLRRGGATPLGLVAFNFALPRVGPLRGPTLGFGTESRWDSRPGKWPISRAQVWAPFSTPRVPEFIVAAYSALLLAGLAAYGPTRTTEYRELPKWRRNAGRPSCQDLVTLLRQQMVDEKKSLVTPEQMIMTAAA